MTLSFSLASTELEKMAGLLDHVVGLSRQLGSAGDGPALRDQIQYDVRGLATSGQNAKRSLAQLHEQSDAGAGALLERFEALRARMQRELPPIVDRLRGAGPRAPPAYTDPLLAQRQLDADGDRLDALEGEVHAVLASMREAAQLFGQTLQEIKRQRRLLVAIDGETARAAEDAAAGAAEVRAADARQRSRTKCICWILLIVALVAAVVALVIVYVVKWSKDPSPTPTPRARARSGE
jgi:hypothetical protein